MRGQFRSILQAVTHSVTKQTRRTVAFTKLLVVSTALMIAPIIPITAFTGTAHAVTDCGGSGNVVQSGSGWLGGGGVNICKNGDGSHNCVSVSGAPGQSQCNNTSGQVYSGDKWQCVEMVNRLYLAKGWTTATLWGNGNSIINDVHNHAGLSYQNDSSISSLNPGDVITETYGTDGHAGIIDSIGSGTYPIHIKSQNADLDSYAKVGSGSLSGGNAHLVLNGWIGYAVQAVIHHPGTISYVGTQLGPGQSLTANQYVQSENGYKLSLDSDKNVRFYSPSGTVLWYPSLSGTGTKLTMQTDGNLVLFNSSNGVVWASGTSGSGAQTIPVSTGALAIQVQSPSEPVLWSTNWSLTPQPSSAGSELTPNQYLSMGQYLANSGYKFTFQYDGNLILWGQAGEVLWSPYTAGQSGTKLLMQTDDNLVLFRADNSVPWASGTWTDSSTCTSCAVLTVMSDGVLAIFGQIPAEPTFWSTNWDTSATPPPTNIGSTLASGQTMYLNQYIQTSGGEYVLQLDGNLVYWLSNGTVSWTPYTQGSGGDRVLITGGAMVLDTPSYVVKWSSNTSSSNPTQADILSGGALVLDYTVNGTTTYIWSTNWNVTPH